MNAVCGATAGCWERDTHLRRQFALGNRLLADESPPPSAASPSTCSQDIVSLLLLLMPELLTPPSRAAVRLHSPTHSCLLEASKEINAMRFRFTAVERDCTHSTLQLTRVGQSMQRGWTGERGARGERLGRWLEGTENSSATPKSHCKRLSVFIMPQHTQKSNIPRREGSKKLIPDGNQRSAAWHVRRGESGGRKTTGKSKKTRRIRLI
jgi:hypothetical protein